MKSICKNLIIIMVLVLLMSGCSSKTNLVDINFNEFKEKISNKETFALYVGNEDCTHCVSYKPVLEEVLNKYDITIYHLDNSKLSSDENSEFKSYINISGTPTVAFITDGEEETSLNRINGEVTKDQTIEKFRINGYIK